MTAYNTWNSTTYIYPPLVFKDAEQQQAFNRLVYNVKKVLPIAKEYNQIIQNLRISADIAPTKRRRTITWQGWRWHQRNATQNEETAYAQNRLLIKLVYQGGNFNPIISSKRPGTRAGSIRYRLMVRVPKSGKKIEFSGHWTASTESVVLMVETGEL